MSARRGWARPLVPLYAAALGVKNLLRKAGVLRAKKLAWPVVSVGSVSAGGAGKTPVVIALANLLSGNGWTVDVLSRGYGRAGTTTQRVPANQREAARECGDEPVLIARSIQGSVWVGASRYEAGQASEQEGRPGGRRVHLLDDGFQHRQLARTLDVVLVTAEDLDDALLPAGNLREPLHMLAEADAVVVRESEAAAVEARVRGRLRGVPLWSVRRSLSFPPPMGVLSGGFRPLAFCAIARPEGFADMLIDAGCGVVETVVFADHHVYTEIDMAKLLSVAARVKATGFVTTEKDGVKLPRELRAMMERTGPLVIVKLQTEFVAADEVMRFLEARLA